MITIIAIPKAFNDEFDVIQRNAIQSWSRMPGVKEVILLGEETNLSTVAAQLGVRHHPHLARDEYGTPLLNDALVLARQLSSTEWLCYVNADILLLPDFGRVVHQVRSQFERALVVSRRWNLALREPIDFSGAWVDEVRARVSAKGKLFTPYGIDVFAFHRSLYAAVPEFAIGRCYWDNWMVRAARDAGAAVVDATSCDSVIHQDHAYEGFGGLTAISESPQGLRNYWLSGDSPFYFGTTDDATHVWTGHGIEQAATRRVSIVVTQREASASPYGCIEALTHQSHPRTFLEILVVSNGGSGPARALELDFPFVKVVRNTGHGVAAQNKGAACASGELLAFVDASARPAPEWIERSIDTIEQFGGDAVVVANTGATTATRSSWRGSVSARGHPTQGCSGRCMGSAAVVTREVWRRVGPLPTDLPDTSCARCEWARRAATHKVTLVQLDDALREPPVVPRWPAVAARSLARALRRWIARHPALNRLAWYLAPTQMPRRLRRLVHGFGRKDTPR